MKKILKIVLLNILFLIFALAISEISIYKHYAAEYTKNLLYPYRLNEFEYRAYFPDYLQDLENYFNGENNYFMGRKPDGLEYKNKVPIVLFGCSYAFGQYLNYNQTLSYKLAHTLKRPVYNRGISSGSYQQMYMQATSGSFYKTIPSSDTVIYVMIHDHARRILLNYFGILDLHLLPHFSIKNGELVMDDYNNKVLNFIKSLYTVKVLNHLFAENFINNKKNAEKLTDITLLYFTKTRKELEKHWNKKFKFYIIMYEEYDILYRDMLKKKLEDNGFTVISTKDLTDENLNDEKYMMQDNHHPTEEAWNLLTPKIVESLKLNEN